ncbi:MAG: aldo/keto reductase [Sphaerochaetaceae bacterium]|jgi:2,5-diketo-D-gluconate reductase A|nr:aldo/keto reductase [Sphaerochaetaceae bacterium]
MESYIKLSDGNTIPMVGYGTFKVTGPSECQACVEKALEVGYRLIDTAQAYGNEEAVGLALKHSLVRREDVFLTTKLAFASYTDDKNRKALDLSLQKLKVDYLDLVLLHWPFNDVFAAWRALEEYQDKALIKSIGVSNFEPSRLVDLIGCSRKAPVINQIETHLYCQRKWEHKWEEKYKVAHQAYAPLGQGRANQMFQEPSLLRIAQAHSRTPAQIALRFLIEKNVVVIPKSVNPDRIKENFEVTGFTLSEQEISELEKLDTGTPLSPKADRPEKVEAALSL